MSEPFHGQDLAELVRRYVDLILTCVHLADNEQLLRIGAQVARLEGGGARLALAEIAAQGLATTRGEHETSGDSDDA